MNKRFAGKKPANKQKIRGGYYTPEILAKFLSDWAVRSGNEHILEPSCGDGNFIEAVDISSKRFDNPDLSMTCVEIDNIEFLKSKKRLSKTNINKRKSSFFNEDFFRVYEKIQSKNFDVVIGNPPFIRFQHFDDDSREVAFDLLRNIGYKPTKLANAWAGFVQLSMELVATGGRLAMVIPAELLQVKYAAELRGRLTQEFEHIVIMSFRKLVFKDLQQEVVLLLAENKRAVISDHVAVHTVDLHDEKELNLESLNEKIQHSKAKLTNKDVKWTSLFLNDEEFEAVENIKKIKGISRLGSYASVDVGVVTGRNSFFVLDNKTQKEFNLSRYLTPLVGKTSALKTLFFDEDKLTEFSKSYPSHLLDLKGVDNKKLNTGVKKYIKLGEDEDVHTGYKCRIRKRWYEVPSTHISDGFLYRQIHRYPLLVENKIKAVCTDTIHRVRLIDKDVIFSQLACSFINSITFAWSEVGGRSYGGGVLELEPNEAEEIPIPYGKDFLLDVELVNSYVESGEIEKALDYVDEKLLVKKLGVSKKKVNIYREAWLKLSSRRIKRK